jgi:hypothetical protein
MMGKKNFFGHTDYLPDEVKEQIAQVRKEAAEKKERQRRENIREDYRRQSDDSMDSFALGMTTGAIMGPQSAIGAAAYWASHGSSSDSYSSSSDSYSSSSDSGSSSSSGSD